MLLRYTRRLLLAAFLLTAPAVLAQQTVQVFVGNQGNFSDANGTVSAYDPATEATTADVIPGTNLVQSLTVHEGRGYALDNTGEKVEVFDLATHTRLAQITGVASPRYLGVVDAGKAYVTNLLFGQNGTVTILDLSTNTVAGTIEVGDSPEGLLLTDGQAYVANSGFGFSTTVSIIDTNTDTVTETLDVGCDGPRFLALDRQDERWVFCAGKTEWNADFTEIISQTNGTAVVLDADHQEVARIPLDAQIGGGAVGQDVYVSPSLREAFVLTGTTVLVFDLTTNTLAAQFTLAGDAMVGGLAYDITTDRFYAARVPSFTDAGYVTVHDRTGAELDRFDAGVAPAAIALYQTGINVAAEASDALPKAFVLGQNYPNPFNPRTTIPFTLQAPARVTMVVYTLTGRRVATLLDAAFASGNHTATWQPSALPSGAYLLRLTVGSQTQTRALTLLK